MKSEVLADKYHKTRAEDEILIKNACIELLVRLKRKRVAVLKARLSLLSRML